MKASNKPRTMVIKSLLSEITYATKNPGALPEGAGPEIVLQRALKKRRDSVEAYRTGGREDLVAQEESEISIIESFLPKQLTKTEIEAIVVKIVAQLEAKSVKDLGRVMKQVSTVISDASASKKDISEVAKKVLSAL
ncbi:hypothetical protein HDV05_000015 [Chytridiales sp. JEL 0842]|nr:hypothetical protein HDV05_000015 [Chytridiales sp. JEL 0842]